MDDKKVVQMKRPDLSQMAQMPIGVLSSIIGYLQTKPYNEVAGLIDLIKANTSQVGGKDELDSTPRGDQKAVAGSGGDKPAHGRAKSPGEV